MANKDGWNKCNYCGKYISLNDFDTGKAEQNLTIERCWDGDEIQYIEKTKTICKRCLHNKDK
jgi:hypothetical protein